MKKKVLFVIHELTSGGAQRVIINLVNNLDREKFDIQLCLFKKKGELLGEVNNDVLIHDLEASRVITSTFVFLKLLLKLKPNIIFSSITHINLLLAIFIPYLKLFLQNCIFISREVNIPSIRAKYQKKSKKLDFFYKFFIHNYTYIIAQSDYMKNDIMSSYDVIDSKIKVINNPLDNISINNKLNNDLFDDLFDDSKTNIISTGSLRYQKGFDNLLNIMTFLDKKYHLYIIGEGSERKKLEEIIIELELQSQVTLLGFQSNPYLYMKQADIVVLSSRYEGFPNVILEANACGKFVIAFECPGVSEEIIENGINGVLIENNNFKSFAEAIQKYSNIKHDENLILETTKRFEVQNIVKNYEAIFLKKENE
jgi:glycosyltransferase involved in cell wall biosynthesis